MKIGIVGLGLIGGSLGLALKKAFKESSIVGFDYSEKHCEEALSLGLVDAIVSFDEIKEQDVIFLAIPVDAIISCLDALQDIDAKTTVIDLGGTKDKIVQMTPPSIRTNLVAAHPMAGTERFGPSAAIEDLFYAKKVVLCSCDESGSLHLRRAVEIFEALGMEILYMEAKAHDLHAAYISHLPHVISYALANTVLKQEDPKSILALAAGGFRDMSRIAKSSPKMWRDIFQQNRINVLSTITDFEKELYAIKDLIEKEKWDDLEDWMEQAKLLHKIL